MMMYPLIKAYLKRLLPFYRGSNGSIRKELLEDDTLLRTLFDAEQYNPRAGTLEKLAIPTSDLQKRGLSLDIKRLAKKVIIQDRIEIQQKKAQEKNGINDTTRKDIYIAELSNPEVRQVTDPQGNILFGTAYNPIEGNDAHSVITCVKKEEKKAYYVMARNKLEPLLLKRLMHFNDYKFND